jgi:hypothetical protein
MERIEREEKEKKRIEIEKKKKELEERQKKLKEKEKKEKIKLNQSIKKQLEEQSILEEIKNNEFDKQNKYKEKDFYKTYLNSLQKRPNSFRQEYFKKSNDFTPIVYKHPENIYLKAISDYQNNKEKMKKYNKKTGQFDLYLNRTRTNKFYIDAENKEKNNTEKDNNNNNNNVLKTSNSNLKSNNNQFKKKNLCINIMRGNSTKNNYNYKNINSPSMKSSYNTFITNNSSNQNKKNTAKKNYSQNNSNKKGNNEEKGEITIDEMINFLLEKENEKINNKKINMINPINYRKEKEQKKKIITSLNDPLNPYSALFYNNMLINNYKVKMHYKNMEQGVPHLRAKKLKKTDLPPLNQGNNNLLEEKMIANTYSSGFNYNKKKKLIILPSTMNDFNRSGSRKKKKENKIAEKDIEGKVLFQSYENKSDFVNNDTELPKVDVEDNNNNNNKKLSGILEEENN